MTTLLEVARSSHEEIQHLEHLVAKQLEIKPASHLQRLYQSHKIRYLVDSITSTTRNLVHIYEDLDHALKTEIAVLGETELLNSFYNKLREIHENHTRYPNSEEDHQDDYLLQEDVLLLFRGEERYGLCLDLHEFYNVYINLKFGNQIEYIDYLDMFSNPDQVPPHMKRTSKYKEYLENLLGYLIDFFQRTNPLEEISRVFAGIENNSQEQESSIFSSLISLDNYANADDLMELGSKKLKEGLAALGLKTGGTVKQQAERLFATKYTPLDQLDRKYFLKGSQKSDNLDQIVSAMEIKLKRICEVLEEAIERTKENVQRKQALTCAELQFDHRATIDEDSEHSEEEEEARHDLYNPRNYPMNSNGKPISTWMYNLHGLKQEFECEICGNCIYKGRRAFELHFNQSRHQHGMRCLGIPNSKSFYEVTSINQVKALWKKIKDEQVSRKWRVELEEFEDDEGNVYSEKMYKDLKRQRLI